MDIYIESVFIICLAETCIPLMLMQKFYRRRFIDPFPAALSISVQYCIGLVMLGKLTSDFVNGPGFGSLNLLLGLSVMTANLIRRLKPLKLFVFLVLSVMCGILTGGFLTCTYPGYLMLKTGFTSAVLLTGTGLYASLVTCLPKSLNKGLRGLVFVKCRLVYGKELIEVTGLVDSGNRLYDPVSRKEVSVIEAGAVRNLMDLPPRGLFAVSCKSIGSEDKLLYGLTFDKLIIGDGSDKEVINNAKIAVYQGKLSKNGDFELLLHGSYLIR